MTTEAPYELISVSAALCQAYTELAEVKRAETVERGKGLAMAMDQGENATGQRHFAELQSVDFAAERHVLEGEIAQLEAARALYQFLIKYGIENLLAEPVQVLS